MAFIWRNYSTPPYDRYALTVVEDASTADGYRITDHDGAVADSAFLAMFREHMARTALVSFGRELPDGTILDGTKPAAPKEPDHFDTAVRSIPGAGLWNRKE